MVADLVDHGFLHLSDDLLLGFTQTQDRAAIDVNAIRQLSAGIKEGVAMDGATPVQPEQLVCVFRLQADRFERLHAGLLLDLDRHVVEVAAEILGQVLHRPGHEGLKLLTREPTSWHGKWVRDDIKKEEGSPRTLPLFLDRDGYFFRTWMPCGSAFSAFTGFPSLSFSSTILLIGAMPTKVPRLPPSSTLMTPTPGVLPTALPTSLLLPVSGLGPRKAAKTKLPSGAASIRSGAGSLLRSPDRKIDPTLRSSFFES